MGKAIKILLFLVLISSFYLKDLSSGVNISSQAQTSSIADPALILPGLYKQNLTILISSCPLKSQGDANCDGRITLIDFEVWRREFTGSSTTIEADFSGDGRITLVDFEVWRRSFTGGTTLPTATPVAFSPTSIPVSASPSRTPTRTPTTSPTNAPTPTPGQPTSGIWISREEIMKLPMNGAAWDSLSSIASGSWGIADIKNQDNYHAVYALGGALYYARTGDAAMRENVRAAIMVAIGTEDGGRTLALGRSLGAYVIAADIIDLRNYNPSNDQTFRNWLSGVRTEFFPNSNPNWQTLVETHEKAAHNWGTFAGASRIAASLYLGDTADITRAARVFEAWLGNRSAYPPDEPWGNYFKKTSSFNASWVCNVSSWIAVNPPCVLSGINVNGVLVEDISRGGSLSLPPGSTGMMYSWEALQGVYVQAELLNRAGYDTYNWSNQALKRAMDFMQRAGWSITRVSQYVPWMANKRYGTNYPTTTGAGPGRVMGYTDWTQAR